MPPFAIRRSLFALSSRAGSKDPYRVCVGTVPSPRDSGAFSHFTQHSASPPQFARLRRGRIGGPGFAPCWAIMTPRLRRSEFCASQSTAEGKRVGSRLYNTTHPLSTALLQGPPRVSSPLPPAPTAPRNLPFVPASAPLGRDAASACTPGASQFPSAAPAL